MLWVLPITDIDYLGDDIWDFFESMIFKWNFTIRVDARMGYDFGAYCD